MRHMIGLRGSAKDIIKIDFLHFCYHTELMLNRYRVGWVVGCGTVELM